MPNLTKTISYIFILFVFLSSCTYDRADEIIPEEDQVFFTKRDGADPTLASNQDRITDNVWITRANTGGQIFNIKINERYDKGNSPVDTEWALGRKENFALLQFAPFRETVKPKEAVGQDLVVHLITDDIYLNVTFTSWSSGQQGGFAYLRDKLPGE